MISNFDWQGPSGSKWRLVGRYLITLADVHWYLAMTELVLGFAVRSLEGLKTIDAVRG